MKPKNLIINNQYILSDPELIRHFKSNIIIYLGIDKNDLHNAPYCFLSKNVNSYNDCFKLKWKVDSIEDLLKYHNIHYVKENDYLSYDNNFIAFLPEERLKYLKPNLQDKLKNILNR
jgi:hypothetical protein